LIAPGKALTGRLKWFVQAVTEKGMWLQKTANWFAMNVKAGANIFLSMATNIISRDLKKLMNPANT